MIFTQLEFVFFIAVVLGFLVAVRHFQTQKIFLLICSYYFYGYWNYKFLGLIVLCTAVNYFCAQQIAASDNRRVRQGMLIVALVFSLGLLGVFKYYNFFIGSLNQVFAFLHWNWSTLELILPVGISFFTFQTLSYTIDVYRKEIEPCRSYTDFSLFVAFFPQLVAGPIVRASEFLPQLASPRSMSWDRTFYGVRQFLFGLFKKVFIADRLAQFVDLCFASPDVYDGWTLGLAVLGYTLQIYCDFSGYSDMAIGLARVMGYDFNVNFNLPYLSKNVSELWHRWHISLSSWLRDYLYIPLGGNRKGVRRSYLNLFLTMLLGGLWHGAAWTFLFWGAWHGAALAGHKCFTHWNRGRIRVPGVVGWLLTFTVVVIGWIFFRAASFEQGWNILCRILTAHDGVRWIEPFTAIILILTAGFHILSSCRCDKLWDLKPNSIYAAVVLFSLLWLVVLFRSEAFQPFIYFQF